MISHRASKISKSFTLALLTALALSACGIGSNKTPDIDEVERDNAPKWAKAQSKPYPLGKPFMVNGCMVQTVRVAVDTPGFTISDPLDYTMAVANCETAKVTSTSKRCGKKECDTVHVEPKAPQPEASAPVANFDLEPAVAQ